MSSVHNGFHMTGWLFRVNASFTFDLSHLKTYVKLPWKYSSNTDLKAEKVIVNSLKCHAHLYRDLTRYL